MGKSLLGSKTVWFNIALGVLIVLGKNIPALSFLADPAVFGPGGILGNIFMRYISDTPITSVLPTVSGGVKSLAGLFLAVGLAGSLAACANDGTLKPSARAKLETASTWAHRGSTTAHALVIGITASCASSTSKFCSTAMPFVLLADGALTIFDKALAAGDAALADGSMSDAALGNALASLISTEKDVEDYIAKIKTQKAMLGDESTVVWPDFGPNS